MLGSAQYVGDLAKRLPPREVNRLTPVYRKITARDIVVERATQFVKAQAIPESPLKDVLIENADVTAKKLFNVADVDGFTVRNSTIRSDDAEMILLDSRNIRFDHVRWAVPGDELIAKVSGDLSNHISFSDCTPEKPKGWTANSLQK
jgi:hypothetical protein